MKFGKNNCQALCDILHVLVHVCLIPSQFHYLHFTEKKVGVQKLQIAYPSPLGKELGFMIPKPIIHTILCPFPKTEGKRNEHLRHIRFDQDCF